MTQNMISGLKSQKVVRACTIRLLKMELIRYEEMKIHQENERGKGQDENYCSR